MRPVVGTATLLLLVLMFMSASAAWDPKQSCETNYPARPCRHKINNENWFQMGDNRCVKVVSNERLSFDDAENNSRGSRFKYVWTDGTDNTFRRWAYGQPDRFLYREECVEMNYWDWTLWNDEQCGHHRSYMCAVRIA